jgi:hypothetical protein
MRTRTWAIAPMLMLLLLLASAAGCATNSERRDALQEMQYDYSAAIRWGDFEGAWNVVDPKYRKEHPMTDLEFERYKQIQVSGYTDLAAELSADGTQARREIQIGVINKHNMTERSIRYTELWRYDPEAKTWWVTSGLPDFWAGM